jgi:uroporphyrin-III C-methyltransferase/precorrin-2 dehydrogenase/sirohydrochlorin ferrochelatase
MKYGIPGSFQVEERGDFISGGIMFLPLQLKVEGRLCVVVGGGKVAARKCRALLEHGARLRVVAPVLVADEIWDAERIEIVHGVYNASTLQDSLLVIAATNDAEINGRVEHDARSAGVLVMRVDSVDDSDFVFPAWLRRGSFTISFGTDGTAPTLSTVMRNDARQCFGEEYAELCGKAAVARKHPEWSKLDCTGRHDVVRGMVQAFTPAYPLSVEDESIFAPRPAHLAPGHVYLVGAGPGDPGLITVKAVECLRAATVVIHDALANPILLDMYCRGTRRIDVSKRKGLHSHMQPEINAMMIECAQEGDIVVRLKGGDPMIFGRVGEEARALAAAGVPFEIVPGISCLASVPAYAGIPITDREFGGHSVGIYSLHLRNGKGLSQEQWKKMANGPDTLVLFMGMTVLGEAVDNLTSNGLPGSTPIALITQGTTDHQREIFSTLDTIVATIADMTLEGPGLIVIGNVVKAAATMSWKSIVQQDAVLAGF